jgi:glutamate-5-semialdehyde dehydrogenase
MNIAGARVGSTEEAIEHIGRYGSGHSEAIVTESTGPARVAVGEEG